MNLQWLYYFDTIAELEHYTKAAEKLHVSQSNLSHAIKELENEVGAELFERKGRNIKLSKYGEIFLIGGKDDGLILKSVAKANFTKSDGRRMVHNCFLLNYEWNSRIKNDFRTFSGPEAVFSIALETMDNPIDFIYPIHEKHT